MSTRTAPVAQQLAVLLRASKLAGHAFDEAWPAALKAARWPANYDARVREREVVTSTIAEWRAAYLDEPTSAARALPVLLDVIPLHRDDTTPEQQADELDRALLTAWAAGTDFDEIAAAFGVSTTRVRRTRGRVSGTPAGDELERRRRLSRHLDVSGLRDPSRPEQAAHAA